MIRASIFVRAALGVGVLWSGIGLDVACAEPSIPGSVATTEIDGRQALVLGFDVLGAFPYELPSVQAAASDTDETKEEISVRKNQIPAAVQAFDGRRVTVSGYMIPLALEDGRARQFVLVRNLSSCCYGVPPNLNEFVLVTMTTEGVRPVMDVPVTLVGTLKVGETYEDNFLVGIYQLDGEKLVPSKS
jgi:hypothetical protein